MTRVRDLLRSALPDTLSLDDIAHRLHLSSRSIHRRLEDEGTSFRGIKDALRRDLAAVAADQNTPPNQPNCQRSRLCRQLRFYRAFVEWTGMAPIHYRQLWSAKTLTCANSAPAESIYNYRQCYGARPQKAKPSSNHGDLGIYLGDKIPLSADWEIRPSACL